VVKVLPLALEGKPSLAGTLGAVVEVYCLKMVMNAGWGSDGNVNPRRRVCMGLAYAAETDSYLVDSCQ